MKMMGKFYTMSLVGTSVSLDTDHTWKLFQDDMGHYRVASDGGEKSIFAKTLIHKCPTPKPAAAKAAAKAAAGHSQDA